MALTRLGTKAVENSLTNIVDQGTEGTRVATGTNAERGNTQGQLRFNTDTGLAEYYTGTVFKAIDTPPTVTSIDTTLIDSASVGTTNIGITGQNFASGATVKAIGSNASEITANSVTFNSQSSLTANFTNSDFINANEPYDIKVTNPSGLSATLDDQINVDVAPTWNTASGSLGTIDHSELPSSYTLTSLSATDADGDTVSYSQPSGSLPSGLTLNSSTGAWSGNVTGLVSTTTFNFTGRASSGTSPVKTTDRSFSIIQEGELNHYGTQYAFSFNGDVDNAGSNTDTYVGAGSFTPSSTGQTKFNSNSAAFLNSSFARFTIPNSSDLQFGTGQFTIEGWVFLVNDSSNVNLSARVFQMGENNSNGIALIFNYSSEFTFSNTHSNFLTDSPSNWLGQWRYFTVDYDGTTYRLYRDGAVVSSATSGFNSVNISDDLHFGVYPGDLTGIRTNMYLSEWQITKGVAKYAGAFTPKTGAFLT